MPRESEVVTWGYTSGPSTMTLLNNLAVLYQNLGKYNAAEPLCVESSEESKSVLGDTQTSTLTAMNNLAVLYQCLGKDDGDAEALWYVECLEKRKLMLGDAYPETLESMHYLARNIL